MKIVYPRKAIDFDFPSADTACAIKDAWPVWPLPGGFVPRSWRTIVSVNGIAGCNDWLIGTGHLILVQLKYLMKNTSQT